MVRLETDKNCQKSVFSLHSGVIVKDKRTQYKRYICQNVFSEKFSNMEFLLTLSD